ncbi:MAG: hypothetical protein WC600_17190 [Desulfobaccales bacterium]
MPTYPAPDARNFTRPGGIALYIDKGAGYVHLGNIDISKMSVEPKNTELEIETQLSGEARTAMILITKRQETYKFPLQEIVPEHLQAFFCGGALTQVNPGTAAIVDQALILAGELPASLGQYNISSVTVRQFLNKVFVYDGAAYTDRSEEADSLAGTPFTTLEDAADLLYLGKATPFQEVYFNFAVEGVYGAVVVKYWNGSAWTAVSNLAGAAAALAADGKMNWDLPTDWAITTVNGYAGYFLQISATTPWTTPATINCIRQNAVRNADYVIDPGQVAGGLLAGRIGRLAAGFLADGEEVKVSYTHATWGALTFPVGTASFLTAAARLDHLTNKGTQFRRYIPKCHLKPDGAMSFDSKNQLLIPMVIEVLDDYANNPTQPYGYVEVL